MTWVKGDAPPAEAENDLRRALRLAWSLPYADFYATADLKTAKRMGGILWLVAWVIVVLLLPVAPPTEHVGGRRVGVRRRDAAGQPGARVPAHAHGRRR